MAATLCANAQPIPEQPGQQPHPEHPLQSASQPRPAKGTLIQGKPAAKARDSVQIANGGVKVDEVHPPQSNELSPPPVWLR